MNIFENNIFESYFSLLSDTFAVLLKLFLIQKFQKSFMQCSLINNNYFLSVNITTASKNEVRSATKIHRIIRSHYPSKHT